MQRLKAILTVVTGLVLALVVLPSGAASAGTSSDGEVTLTAQNLTLPKGWCGDEHFSVSGPFSSYPYWNVDVTVYDPHGVDEGGAYFYQGDGDDGADTTYLCTDYDLHGTYRVTADYELDDADYNTIRKSTVTSYFTFGQSGKSASSLSKVKIPYGKHGWKVVGTLSRAGGAWGGHPVQLQTLKRGTWRTVATHTSGTGGRVAFLPKPKKGSFRLHSAGGSVAADANSPTFKLTKRR